MTIRSKNPPEATNTGSLGLRLSAKNNGLRNNSSSSGGHQTLLIEKGKLQFNILVQNILFVRAEHVYCRIYFYNDQRILQRTSLENLLTKLPEDKFLRVHRSYAINVDYIQRFNSSSVLLGEEVKIPIGRTWRDKVVARLRELEEE